MPPERRDWSRAELLAALSLYCQIPFGQFHHRNRHVIGLAHQLGRTPSAVAMKLGNLASLDPFHAARGVRGMGNASNADRAVWGEFSGRWDDLAAATPASLADTMNDPLSPVANALPEPDPSSSLPSGPTEATRLATFRRGQGFFRNAVLSAYDARCCITGIAEPALLRASHIRAWAEFPPGRLDPSNGLCLNALHDAAFDRGLISFTAELELLISPRLHGTVPAAIHADIFARFAGAPLRLPARFTPDPAALAHHRGYIFAA